MPDVFSRLAKEDKMLREKKQVLIDLYTPSFQPNTFIHKEGKKPKKKKKEINIDVDFDKYHKKKSKKK